MIDTTKQNYTYQIEAATFLLAVLPKKFQSSESDKNLLFKLLNEAFSDDIHT